jgi:hypothetical protein
MPRVRAWPRLARAAGTDRTGAENQHLVGLEQFLVRPAEVVQRLTNRVGAGLGRVGVAEAGGQDHVFRRDTLARGQGDTAGVHRDHAVAYHLALREQRLEGEEHVAAQSGWVSARSDAAALTNASRGSMRTTSASDSSALATAAPRNLHR